MKSHNPIQSKPLPIAILVASLLLAGVVFWLSQSPSSVFANTGDKALAEGTYPNIVGSRIDSCLLCHASYATIPNLNSYGTAYNNLGRNQATSLHLIESIDSDGDGYTNLQELTALTFPGDPADFPQTAPTATNTSLPPTNTSVPPTNTSLPPTLTATKIAATITNTSLPATATATKAVSATPTRIASPTRTPQVTGTVVKTPTGSKTPMASRTPSVQPTQCVRDDDDDADNTRSSQDRGQRRTQTPCPPGYHEREDDEDGSSWLSSLPGFTGQMHSSYTFPKRRP